MLTTRVILALALVLTFVGRAHAQGLPRAAARGEVGLSSLAYRESFGFRDREAQAPMSPDAIHRIASMTKPLVSVAAMMLVEEGRLSLTDPVALHLPELKELKVGVEKKDDASST